MKDTPANRDYAFLHDGRILTPRADASHRTEKESCHGSGLGKERTLAEVFEPTSGGYKKRCFTFLHVLCNDKDMKQAATYLAPDCILIHEDFPPVHGAEAFISSWGATL